MKITDPAIFTLENFEGPLDLLWHLITKQEMDIYEIPIKQIVEQYLKNFDEESLDDGAEFIALAASIVLFKSKTLLPKHEQQGEELLEQEEDPRFNIIHHLVDYCKFKEAAKQLSEREQQQNAYYFRGIDNDIEVKKKLGIDHLSIEDLAELFQSILAKSVVQTGVINEEEWRVGDKIIDFRRLLLESPSIPFTSVFYPERSRMELIVLFLALLELMKLGEARVGIDKENQTVNIFSATRD